MEIKIKTLRLRNFKGVRDAEFYFGGGNARIEGANGTGKSTVFDAFTWLLFGKDHRGQTPATFEIKTIDPETGQPTPRLEHWVEADLLVDGVGHTLRRCWVEDWITPTGKVDPILKGHKSIFVVDGVDVGTQKAYDTTVQAWLNEDAFRMLTDPLFFIGSSDWKKRRNALLDLVKDNPQRLKVQEEFADVVDKISGRSIEDYRKRLDLEKRANKRDLAICLSNIDGMRITLPEEVDATAVTGEIKMLQAEREKKLDELRAKIAEIDASVVDYNAANAEKKARVDAIWAEITKVQLEMGETIAREQKAAQDENNRAKAAALQAWTELAEIESRIKNSVPTLERELNQLDELHKERGMAAQELTDLGEEYRAEKAQAFEYSPETTCPYCGQEIPAATREEAEAKARAAFLDARKAVLQKIVKRAEDIKAHVRRIDETIEKCKSMIAGHTAAIEKARADRVAKEAEYNRLKAVPMKDLDAITEAIRIPADKKVLELRMKASKEGGSDDTLRDLSQRRRDLEKEADRITAEYSAKEKELTARVAVNAERNRQLGFIASKERDASNFADAIAKAEREEARIAEYIEADIRSVEGALADLFKVARWKMFDRTLDGGLVEMCEVMDPDSTPYRSMNDAMRILCGMDVIRVFSDRFGASAPIFIDNAEGVLQKEFDTTSQVIRLVVKDCPITLVNE